MDRTCVCVGMATQYIIVDYETGRIQDLFPIDSERTRPIVTRISKVNFFSHELVSKSADILVNQLLRAIFQTTMFGLQDEFLLSAPSALGMFAKSSGISQRPPLQWSDNLMSVVYTHPYILALNDEFVTIHR